VKKTKAYSKSMATIKNENYSYLALGFYNNTYEDCNFIMEKKNTKVNAQNCTFIRCNLVNCKFMPNQGNIFTDCNVAQTEEEK
jgi:hypothetical protein